MGFRAPISSLAQIADARALANAGSRNAPLWNAATSQWEPSLVASAAIAVVDEAETFAEADVTVTHDDTEVASGVLQLKTPAGTGNVASWSESGSLSSVTDRRGIRFVPAVELGGVIVQKSTSVTATRAYLVDLTGGGTVLATLTGVGTYATFTGVQLLAGRTYAVTFDEAGASYTHRGMTPTLPIASADLSVTGGVYSGTTTTVSAVYNVTSVQGISKLTTEGAPVVTWDQPSALGSWDVAAWDADAGGGTLTVALVDADDGTVYADNVSSPAVASDVPAAANLALRFTMTRPAYTDTSPTVEWCARRYTR